MICLHPHWNHFRNSLWHPLCQYPAELSWLWTVDHIPHNHSSVREDVTVSALPGSICPSIPKGSAQNDCTLTFSFSWPAWLHKQKEILLQTLLWEKQNHHITKTNKAPKLQKVNVSSGVEEQWWQQVRCEGASTVGSHHITHHCTKAVQPHHGELILSWYSQARAK